ncbi:Zn-dependent hydrolases, including glyoxylases [Candidatus Scalindua japonica]|uniref:Zn-dependent hydrolases, including glyoxylases n=1 Tax=Candidatus Scalindua japonica TaxID=1284222 RepID=A0A286U1M5_9BACT|nr:MBL fold metallo-hydrolase [Candidatus Scalindua japonica]GAX62034.1 Zn-dependent hydrolases, including glyoxylases [Candidatus Scalindua japonica]
MKIGNYELHSLETGRFALDGGAMFGIVPKVIWSKLHPPDDQNRVEMALRSLLIIDDKRKILVDTGIGTKLSENDKEIYKLDQTEYNLEASLEKYDLETKDITDVVLTHLHLDHVGGATYLNGNKHKLTFPNASHYVQKTHHEWASKPSEKDKGSFITEDFKTIEGEGKLRLVDGYAMILPNIDVIIYDGHTTGQQVIKISDGINTLVCCGDVIPFTSHIRIPYIASYDINPITSSEDKEKLLSRASNGDWTLFFVHDPVTEAVKVEKSKKGYTIKETISL